MPKDNILRAIKRGQGNDPDTNYEEVRYEGYGPKGTAVIVEALTNNKNRTASEVRTAFSKNGGTLGETGSVSYNFRKVGNIIIDKKDEKEEEITDFVIENGSTDIEIDNSTYSIYCELDNYHQLIEKITEKFSAPKSSQIIWISDTSINLELESAQKMINLINTLEDNEDVQNVSSNFEITNKIMEELIN